MMYQGPPTLIVAAHGANDLKDVEFLGKQDPYFQFSLDLQNPKSFQKTFVHKNAGKNATWNQTFTIPLNGEPELYFEIMDDEMMADAVIAFGAIPINQVVHAPGGTLQGVFDVFTPNGEQHGQLNLTLTAQNVPGQATPYGGYGGNMGPVKGVCYINELHQKRIKALKNKETASDVGAAVGTGLLAVGAGLLVGKLVGDHNREEEERKEAERRAEEERAQFEEERRRLDDERERFERQQRDEEDRRRRDDEDRRRRDEEDRRRREDEDRYDDRHEDHRHRESCHDEFEAGRWYSAGDKVSYHGETWVVLQGHTSQPDWTPGVAHSLWTRY